MEHLCLSVLMVFRPGSHYRLQTSLAWIEGEYFCFEVGMQEGLIVVELEASFPKLPDIKGGDDQCQYHTFSLILEVKSWLSLPQFGF